MILPEQSLAKRRLQILGDEAAPEKRALDLLEKEDRWLRDFIEPSPNNSEDWLQKIVGLAFVLTTSADRSEYQPRKPLPR